MDTGLDRSLEGWKYAIATVRFVSCPLSHAAEGG